MSASTHRLNAEPSVLLGLSRHEIALVAGLTCAITVPGCVLLSLLAGAMWMPVALASLLILGFLSFWLSARALRRMKRDYPDGWFAQRAALGWSRLFGVHSRWYLPVTTTWEPRRDLGGRRR